MMCLGNRHLPACLCLCLLLGLSTFSGGVSAEGIIATVGTDVTLPCNFNAKYYGKLPACWGRGPIPNRGCSNEVIKSDGTSATSRLSERYLFMGDLSAGDVSLTIRQLEEGDSGVYGCRVDIPGWFNDHKHQLTLTVLAVRPNPLRVETREVKERSFTVRWTPAFDGGRPITSYRIDIKSKQASWDTAVTTEISNPDLTQIPLVDLRPAKTYNLRVFATNSMGTSEASNVLTVTTKEAAPDGPPLDMQLVGHSPQSIKVTWKPPRLDQRNGVLRSYSISYREYDPEGGHFKRWQHLSLPATWEVESLLLSNLKPSTRYGVMIQAKTQAGIGPASSAPLCSTLDEVQRPTAPSTSMSASTAATLLIEDTTSFTSVHTTSTVESVTAATHWEDTTAIFSSVPPDPPVVELKEVKGNAFSLVWTPGFEGDSPITGYYLEYKAVHALWDNTKTVVDFSPNQTEATILEMNPSTYNVRMFAKNSLATSKASNILTITITTGESVPPDPPVLELKEVEGIAFSLVWTPGFEGDSPITGYYLEYKAVNALWDNTKTVVDFGPNQTEATILEMNPSTYNVRMFAKNSLATSKASNILTITITTGESGHQTSDPVTTVSTDTHAAASVEDSRSVHLAAIVVPVVLVALAVAVVTTWQLRRKKGSLSMWLPGGALRYSGSDSLQEL